MSLGAGYMGGAKSLKMPLLETLRQAWADPDLRARILFVFGMFAVYVVGIHIPVPIPGVSSAELEDKIAGLPFFQMLDIFGGGAIRRISVFALGLNPYITSSIIMQILTTSIPAWKKELQEGGEYARRAQNKRTRGLALVLCVFQSLGFIQAMGSAVPMDPMTKVTTIIFWTAGAMFVLWLGEQISEKGIGNGVSLMIFAGIVISLPYQVGSLFNQVSSGGMYWWQLAVLALVFLATTWFIVLFTSAQRRIPVQHMRRQVGTKAIGGQTSYLPIPVNTAGVIPIIFAVSLIFIPQQFASFFPPTSDANRIMMQVAAYLNPGAREFPEWLVGSLVYMVLIFFFTYFYTAIQYNVEDLSNNLKRGGSFIPGVRPGKQTKDFLDSVISRVTIAGAFFLTIVALVQYFAPKITGVTLQSTNIIGGTSMLIMVSVALETMRQIEANLLMKHYGQ